MNVRELLRKEIWSKETSRKILVVLGVLIIGIQIFHEVDSRWITPAERKTGRAALIQIDALQSFGGMNDAQFGEAARKAEEAVEGASDAAWTTQDRAVAGTLSGYLEMTKLDCEEASTASRLSDSKIERVRKLAALTPQAVETSETLRRIWDSGLHKTLDR